MKQELIKKIKEYFGLNIYETKVWVALLSRGVASAGEVAEISGVPRSRTYDVLESLEKRGFAIIKIGKPVRYIAVKPPEVIEKIKANVLIQAQDKIKSLSNLKETQEYAELEQLYNSGINPIKSQEITGAIRGRANIVSRLRELIENSEREVYICTSVFDFEDKSRALIPVIEKVMKRNVKVKLALSGESENIRRLANKFNLRIKQTDNKARMFIADRKEILFMITSPNSEEEMGVWLNSPFFTNSLIEVIDLSLKSNHDGTKKD